MINIRDDEFKLLAEFIKSHSGINLKIEKKALLTSRLNSLLEELKMSSFMEFYKFLKNDKEEVVLSKLINRITTNHTYFMRESEHFTFLKDNVLPFLNQTVKHRDLRIWCAASSSGEEPYTISMILEDYFGKSPFKWDKKILATDISTNILDIAKKGIYLDDKIEKIPKIWRLNYFDKIDKFNHQVNNKIRNEVIYRRFNLLEPVFPFKKKFHVIFCRNVMIYFDNKTRDELIEKFYNSLEYGGYLFIGHSESINKSNSKFKSIRPSVYRKI